MGHRTSAVASVLALLAVACTDPSPPAPGAAIVAAVVDGDTIDVEIGGRRERVRLIGIDTPETVRPGAPVECFGPEASAFTAALLPVGAEIRIERDVVGRDHFGRLLGYVFVVDGTGEETFANLEIVRQGYATTMAIEPNMTFSREFIAAARAAEAVDLGLWAACSP
jgi:micrococcal nuclease